MGAGQSTVAPVEKSQETLYDILGVSKDVTEAELRKIYKKQALLLHPDRNYDNVEEATKKFARIQAAYDVLIDPQERAWYDSHGDSNGPNTASRNEPEYGGRITTAEELKQYLDPAYYQKVFPNGTDNSLFYETVCQLFKQLIQEEHEAALDAGLEPPLLPSFGDADSQWNKHVKPFYDTWSSFSSLKNFAWEDIYRAWDAPDRRSRRAMEMRNKKIRDASKKEFNQLVRSLVVVIRKKDPRVKQHNKASVKQNDGKERAEAAKKKSNEQKKQRAAQHAAEYIPQAWENPDELENDNIVDGAGNSDEDSGSEVVDLYECIVCDKIFKTKKQLEAHEESKKHLKMLRQMQREMRREGLELGIDTGGDNDDDNDDREVVSGDESRDFDHSELNSQSLDSSSSSNSNSNNKKNDSNSDESEGEPEPDKKDVSDLLKELEGLTLGSDKEREQEYKPPKKAAGKAKLRRMKKDQANNEMANVCAVCNTVFPSRNKLFEHVKISGHAAPLRR